MLWNSRNISRNLPFTAGNQFLEIDHCAAGKISIGQAVIGAGPVGYMYRSHQRAQHARVSSDA